MTYLCAALLFIAPVSETATDSYTRSYTDAEVELNMVEIPCCTEEESMWCQYCYDWIEDFYFIGKGTKYQIGLRSDGIVVWREVPGDE